MNFLKLTTIVILVELALVLFIVIATYVLVLGTALKHKWDKCLYKELEHHLKLWLQSHPFKFKRRWKCLDILLDLIKKNDHQKTLQWLDVRSMLLTEILLPLARKKSRSIYSKNRILAAQTFCMVMTPEDLKVISVFLKDPKPLIHLNAAIAALNYCDVILVNEVLDAMASMRRLGQSMYLELFAGRPTVIGEIILSRLKREEDLYTKAACYRILVLFPSDLCVNKEALYSDVFSTNKELQISSMHYLAYADNKHAITPLITLLNNQFWEVRAIACKLLGDLCAQQAIDALEFCLRDKVWDVRLNAAVALKNLGESGILRLKYQNPETDLYAYDMALYVLKNT